MVIGGEISQSSAWPIGWKKEQLTTALFVGFSWTTLKVGPASSKRFGYSIRLSMSNAVIGSNEPFSKSWKNNTWALTFTWSRNALRMKNAFFITGELDVLPIMGN
jgi:hypothetical protein